MKTHLFILTILTVACSAPGMNNQTELNPSVISEAEIDASSATTAYDAVKKLRANFLTYRGETSLKTGAAVVPAVYLDGQLFGDLSSLKQLMANQISEIRLYRSWEATSKFGTGHMAGVIAIITRQ